MKQFCYMEVILSVIRRHIDKFAVLNRQHNEIYYTRKHSPKQRRGISSMEGKRIFEDLYGTVDIQCVHKWSRTLKRLRKATLKREC